MIYKYTPPGYKVKHNLYGKFESSAYMGGSYGTFYLEGKLVCTGSPHTGKFVTDPWVIESEKDYFDRPRLSNMYFGTISTLISTSTTTEPNVTTSVRSLKRE